MWYLKRQTIRNVFSIKNLDIEYNIAEKLILLNGWNYMDGNSNGAGKSSLIDCVLIAAFGQVARGAATQATLNLDDVIRTGRNSALIQVELEDPELKTILKIEWKKFRGRSAVTKLWINGEDSRFTTSKKTRKHMEQNIFKFTGKSFTRLHLFRSSNYTQFFALPPRIKSALLEQYITMAPFKVINTLLKRDCKNYEMAIDGQKGKIAEKERFLSGAEKLQIEQLEQMIRELEKKEQDYVNQIREASNSLDPLKLRQAKLADKQKLGAEKKAEIGNLQLTASGLSAEIKKEIKYLESQMKDTGGVKTEKICPKCRGKVNPLRIDKFLRQCERDKKQQLVRLTNVNRKATALKGKLEDLQEKIQIIEDRIQSLKEQESKLNITIEFYNKECQNIQLQIEKIKEKFTKRIGAHHEKIKEEIEFLKSGIEKLLDDINKFEFMIELTGKGSQFKKYMFSGALKIIEKLMNNYLPYLLNYKTSVQLYTETKFNVTDVCCRLPDGRTYFNLSGGEQRIIDIAALLAFIELTMRTQRTNFGIVFVDEPFTNMSRQLCARSTDLFLRFAREFDIQFFFVSHNYYVWENKAMFDKVITVVKTKEEISMLGDIPQENEREDEV